MLHLLLAVIYLAFISLGLPDALLGAAWPSMYPMFGVPVSCAGIVSMVISCGTISSSLLSDRLTRALGPGRVTAISVGITAAALMGFSSCTQYWQLILWAIPYGLGAGSVDAALNNYVALHYASRHMSWLHCMWGIGAATGPYIMGYALSGSRGWPAGYQSVAFLQIGLTAMLLLSLPLWKTNSQTEQPGKKQAVGLGRVFSMPGAKEVLITFFCYCGLEQTVGLWASSYLALHRMVQEDTAATWGGLFYVGITVGRAISGFLTLKFNDVQMIRLGEGLLAIGVVTLLLPWGIAPLIGLILLGLGCAPVYPCIIHSTPAHFGAENSQALIGVQMAFAYLGSLLLPPLFGLIAGHIQVALLPVYLCLILAIMAVMHERLLRKCQ